MESIQPRRPDAQHRQCTPWFVDMAGVIWQGSHDMTSNSTHSGLPSKVFLALLLLSVVLTGIPIVEVHSHENATIGHSHDAHDFFDDHGADETDSEDGDADTASFHAHDVNATSLSVISSVSVDFSVPRHSHSHIPPPYGWLPDNFVVPLYRPPIA